MNTTQIRNAFLAGKLRVKSVDSVTGEIGLHCITDVMKHATPHKKIFKVTLENGASIETTEDHSLFVCLPESIVPIAARDIYVGCFLAYVKQDQVLPFRVTEIVEKDPHSYTYDLSVPKTENFVAANGILCHNSYSIGGISLDLDKSSKYESLKQNAEGQLEKFSTDAKPQTVRYIKGLQQPRFGVGVRSSFGPSVGKGVLSPRSFI